MSAKAKYEKIDKSKLNDSLKKLLSVMKEKTDNFENEEVVKQTKVEEALDKLIKKYPDAVKKPSKSRTKKSSKAKKSSAKRETVMTVAKRIRKKDESWQDAMKRAKLEMSKSNTKVKKQVDTELEKLQKMIKEDAVLKGFSNSQLQRDAVRKAKPRGKRKSTTKGETTNQYGTFKNKVGRPYWESRENRSDRYAPKYPANKPFLEDGGVVVGGSTVLRNNADIMDLGIANSDAVFMHGGAIHEMRKEKDIDIYDEQMAKGGEIETKREFVEVVNQVKDENEAFPNDFVNVMDSINAILQDRGYEEDDEYTYDVRQEILDRYEKKVLDKQGLRFAKGGMMQGYNARLDESLGMREGREDEMMQSYKDRRNESKGMEKAMGRRAYQSVGTMDEMGMGGYLLAGGTGAYLGAKYPNKVKKVTDPLDKAVEDINRNLRNRYEDGGLVVGGSTVVRNNGDIMPLGTANADAVFQTGGVTAQTVVNPNEAMADLTSTYGFDDVYAKGGVAEGYSKFRVVFYNYSGETEEKEFDYYSDAYDYYNGAVDDEVGGGTTTIILQGYSDKYDEFEDIFYFDPMEMSEQDEDFAKGGSTPQSAKYEIFEYLTQSARTPDNEYTINVNDFDKLIEKITKRALDKKIPHIEVEYGGSYLGSINERRNYRFQIGSGFLDNPLQSKMSYINNQVNPKYRMAKGGKVDDLGNPTDPKVISQMEKFIKEKMPKLDKDRFFTDGMKRKEAKRMFYKKYGYGAYDPRFSIFEKGGRTMYDAPPSKIGKVKFSLAKGRDFDIIVPEGKFRILRTRPFDLPTAVVDMNKGKNFQKTPVNDSKIAKKYQKEIQEYLNMDNTRFAKGGKIGFEALSKKVAKRYVGKKVPEKFQNEYGKTYSPAEAKEVGDKVAGAVYRMQQAKKMAKGGKTQGKIYIIQEKSKYDLGVPKWKDEKFLTGGKKYLSYKDAQDEKKKLQRMSSSIQYKVVEWTPKLGFAKGGKTQGYNDKLDESLGNTKGKRSTKEQNYKDRRNESEAMEKKGGKRKYARVKTMDKGSRKLKKPNSFFAVVKRKQKKGEAWKDAIQRVKNEMKK